MVNQRRRPLPTMLWIYLITINKSWILPIKLNHLLPIKFVHRHFHPNRYPPYHFHKQKNDLIAFCCTNLKSCLTSQNLEKICRSIDNSLINLVIIMILQNFTIIDINTNLKKWLRIPHYQSIPLIKIRTIGNSLLPLALPPFCVMWLDMCLSLPLRASHPCCGYR